jgi:hypothetical protein
MAKANEDLVFVDKKVIGRIHDGVFVQKTTERHIFRELNAKGMDVDVHGRLAGRCHTWRLEFKDTKQVLAIPFAKIAQVGTLTSTGAGAQYLVKLSEFNEDRPVIQHALPGLFKENK